MGLVEKFSEFKKGTKAKLVRFFSKKYQPTFEEVKAHIDKTYTSKANAVIGLTGEISYFSESWFDEVKQNVNTKIMGMVPLKHERDVKDLYEETYFGVVEEEEKVTTSYETHYIPSHTAAVEYVEKQKHLPKTDRAALLDGIAYTHAQVEKAKDNYLNRFGELQVNLTVARIAKIKNLESQTTQTSSKGQQK